MSPKILRRCSMCGKFHASYLVQEQDGGKGYYCYDCWKARFGPKPELAEEGKAKPQDMPSEDQLPGIITDK